jgi:hypothetical protein
MKRKVRPPALTRSGTVVEVRHCGSVVLVVIRTSSGITSPVAFEHRAFTHFLQATAHTATDLIARTVTSDGLSMTLLD